jgi:hypothetical protein
MSKKGFVPQLPKCLVYLRTMLRAEEPHDIDESRPKPSLQLSP